MQESFETLQRRQLYPYLAVFAAEMRKKNIKSNVCFPKVKKNQTFFYALHTLITPPTVSNVDIEGMLTSFFNAIPSKLTTALPNVQNLLHSKFVVDLCGFLVHYVHATCVVPFVRHHDVEDTSISNSLTEDEVRRLLSLIIDYFNDIRMTCKKQVAKYHTLFPLLFMAMRTTVDTTYQLMYPAWFEDQSTRSPVCAQFLV